MSYDSTRFFCDTPGTEHYAADDPTLLYNTNAPRHVLTGWQYAFDASAFILLRAALLCIIA
jgi:hypothetical protein